MKKFVGLIIAVCLSVISLFTLFGCQSNFTPSIGGNDDEQTEKNEVENGGNNTDNSAVTTGTETYRDFILDCVYHSENNGDIHFNLYVPETYDGSKAYALFVSLPGYEGLYFQGVGTNIRAEQFVFEARKYNSEMIIVAPQLNDWGNTSAN